MQQAASSRQLASHTKQQAAAKSYSANKQREPRPFCFPSVISYKPHLGKKKCT